MIYKHNFNDDENKTKKLKWNNNNNYATHNKILAPKETLYKGKIINYYYKLLLK